MRRASFEVSTCIVRCESVHRSMRERASFDARAYFVRCESQNK
jgi:hypothetical protein